ncbi:ABC transporter ATP-binding protein [Microbacterium sp. B2969]|uniref:ABC transporter ATP-binding protein n=1 Tax=Microbacterium alkaliflavum TaxID=3248839 RepID=A0ABW7Q2K1_9MICO
MALRSVTRLFRGGAGVEQVDLQIGFGEIVALVGLNGAGKTTLMRLQLGMLRPDSGQSEIDGTPLRDVDAATWARVGHLVEAPLAYGELTVREVLEMNLALRGGPRSAPRIDAAIETFALAKYEHRRIRTLSMGNAQRVGLAAALQHEPTIVVLDEPTNALDPAGVIVLRETLRSRAGAGAGILVSSHHLDEVARIADRIVVMNAGRLIGELAPHEADLERLFFDTVLRDDQARLP